MPYEVLTSTLNQRVAAVVEDWAVNFIYALVCVNMFMGGVSLLQWLGLVIQP